MPDKPRERPDFMFYDGTAEAIKNIRLRQQDLSTSKQFTQARCAQRANMKTGAWSNFETGNRRYRQRDLQPVLRGLQCTEQALWDEKIRVERLHYLSRAAEEIGEPAPAYGSAWGGIEVHQLYALDTSELPPEHRDLFHRFRNHAAANYASAITEADAVKTLFETYKKRAAEARKAETVQDSEETAKD